MKKGNEKKGESYKKKRYSVNSDARSSKVFNLI